MQLDFRLLFWQLYGSLRILYTRNNATASPPIIDRRYIYTHMYIHRYLYTYSFRKSIENLVTYSIILKNFVPKEAYILYTL